MKKELYMIELENGEYARLLQESETDICVNSCPDEYFYCADIMGETEVLEVFNDLKNKESRWNYYGKCLKPKTIRKVTIELI